MKNKYYLYITFLLSSILSTGCNKLLDVKPPIDSITTSQVFQDDAQATIALNGLYSYLIHGNTTNFRLPSLGNELYSAGGITVVTAHSADELYHPALVGTFKFYHETVNNLTLTNSQNTDKLWSSAYKAIYNANSLIEGINESDSKELTESTKRRIKGEALTVRAMSYFYMVNIFRKIPLALTIDFNKTKALPSADSAAVYRQIIQDLEEAVGYLSDKYEGDNAERIRINKWYTKGLLARVYLFTRNYEKAYEHSNDVINQTLLFDLEAPNTSFKYNSKEVIFQLKQDNTGGNSTPEGTSLQGAYLTPGLVNAFEPGDKRKTSWTIDVTAGAQGPAGVRPRKYELNDLNDVPYGFRSEYYVVMRIAEMHLIRAEANLRVNTANKNKSIDDLNELRGRADLTDLPYTLTDAQVVDAIAQERRVELFVEWGHRWLDLKRTGKVDEVLSQIPYKQPWNSFQLLYPVPPNEIIWDNNLSQNIGYY